MKVGMIGLGLMGLPMARRLEESGADLTVTSRRLVPDAPGTWVESVEDLAGHDVVVTMLPAGADVAEVVARLVSGGSGAVVVDMSTIGPQWARRVASLASEAGAAFVDAPVSGGPAGAASGSLAIMAGGSAADVDRVRPVLEAFGEVHHLGPVGAGQAAKLVNQVVLAGIMSGIADGFSLVEAAGLDAGEVHAAIGGGMAGGRLLDFAWPRLIDDDLSPGFKISHFVKDLDLALDEGAELGVPLELTARVRAAYASLLPALADGGTQALIRYQTKDSR